MNAHIVGASFAYIAVLLVFCEPLQVATGVVLGMLILGLMDPRRHDGGLG